MSTVRSRIALAIGALLLSGLSNVASGGVLTIPWNVNISIPAVSPPYEASWVVDFPFSGYAGAAVDVGFEFPTKHTPAYEIHLPYQVAISYPDVVLPGQRVQLTTSVSLSGPASFTTFGSGEFDSVMTMSVDGEGTFPFLSLKDTLGAVVPEGHLWGGWSWIGTDTAGDASTLGSHWAVDHFGNGWTYLPGLDEFAPELRASSLTYANQGTAQVWNVPRMELLDKLGDVGIPGASLVGLLYDIYIEADDTLREISWLRTGMLTGYFTPTGGGAADYRALGLNTGVIPYLEVPSTGLSAGDVFEFQLTGLGFDYLTAHNYELKGRNEYGAEILSLIDVPAISVGSDTFVDLGTWGTDHRYFDSMTGGNVIRFVIADSGEPPTIPEPASLGLLGVGLAALVVARRRRS